MKVDALQLLVSGFGMISLGFFAAEMAMNVLKTSVILAKVALVEEDPDEEEPDEEENENTATVDDEDPKEDWMRNNFSF